MKKLLQEITFALVLALCPIIAMGNDSATSPADSAKLEHVTIKKAKLAKTADAPAPPEVVKVGIY